MNKEKITSMAIVIASNILTAVRKLDKVDDVESALEVWGTQGLVLDDALVQMSELNELYKQELEAASGQELSIPEPVDEET